MATHQESLVAAGPEPARGEMYAAVANPSEPGITAAPATTEENEEDAGGDAMRAMQIFTKLFWLLIIGLTVAGFALGGDIQQFMADSQDVARESKFLVVPGIMALYILVAVGAPPGNTWLCVLAGLFYGWWALLLCLGWGALCASSIGFLLCRTFGRAQIERMVERKPKMKALRLAINDNALFVTAVARLSPILPFGPSTVVMSVSTVELPLFALGTFLGLVPYDCAAIYFGTTISDISKVKEITQEPATIAVTIVGFTLSVTMLCFIGRLAKRKMDELTQPQDQDERVVASNAAPDTGGPARAQ